MKLFDSIVLMVSDLIHDLSPREFQQLVGPLVAANTQPLPLSAKQFMAVARLQGHDGLPELADRVALDAHVRNGCTELNRGLVATPGLSAVWFATTLFSGTMYPGTVTVHGHGIYFGEPSQACSELSTFPRISQIATWYATRRGVGGVVVRGVLKSGVRTIDQQDLREIFRSDKNRAARAGITDVGVFAAALGIDAYFIDGAFTYSQERMWVVTNRRALVLQRTAFQIADIENPSGK